MATNTPPPALPSGSVDALKRVKAAETEWELKLRVARGAAAEAMERLRADCEAAVKSAQAVADGERAQALLAARQEAEHEATEILTSGTQAADVAARGEGKRPADKKDAVLAAVLAGFYRS
jgi:vacuolar-type H+-ATPase subunit H